MKCNCYMNTSEIYLPYLPACLQILQFLHLDMLKWSYAVSLYQSNEAFQLSSGKPTPTMNSTHLVTRRKSHKVATILLSRPHTGRSGEKYRDRLTCSVGSWNVSRQLLRIKDREREDQTLQSIEGYVCCVQCFVTPIYLYFICNEWMPNSVPYSSWW